MNSNLSTDFFLAYEEIRSKFEVFIRKTSVPKIKLLDIPLNMKLASDSERYYELFSCYATDMLIANRFYENLTFSIKDFVDCDSNFLIEFESVSNKLHSILSEFEFSRNDNSTLNRRITPEIFHILGEQLVRREDQDSGVVFTPIGVVKFLCFQSLIFYLQQNLQIDSFLISDLVLNPSRSISERLSKNELDDLYHLLNNIQILDPACGSGLFCISIVDSRIL